MELKPFSAAKTNRQHFAEKYFSISAADESTYMKITKKSIKSWRYITNKKERYIDFKISGGNICFNLPIIITEADSYLDFTDSVIAINSSDPIVLNKFLKFFKELTEDIDYTAIPAEFINKFNTIYNIE